VAGALGAALASCACYLLAQYELEIKNLQRSAEKSEIYRELVEKLTLIIEEYKNRYWIKSKILRPIMGEIQGTMGMERIKNGETMYNPDVIINYESSAK